MSKIIVKTLNDLSPHPENPRTISDEELQRLEKSLKEFGDLSGFVFNTRTGRLVGGHQRKRVLPGKAIIKITHRIEEPTTTGTTAMGYADVGGERFSYREVDWPEQKEKAANIAANKHGGHFENRMLADWINELDAQNYDLDLTGFAGEDLENLMAPFRDMPDSETEDQVPEVPKSAKSKTGDLWTLGEHRLLCGDCTLKENVGRLMAGEKADMVFTDPPYGIDIYSKGSFHDGKKHGAALAAHNSYRPVEGDKDLKCVSFLFEWLKAFRGIAIVWGANNFPQFCSPSNGWLVWDKEQHANHGDCELAWTNVDKAIRMFTHQWVGFQKASERGEKRVHPTQKPVALAEWAFEVWESPKTVLDLFLGSGSTLIACEKTNRRCFGMEIDPHYCDVIIERWEKYSGKKAVRHDGKLFQEI